MLVSKASFYLLSIFTCIAHCQNERKNYCKLKSEHLINSQIPIDLLDCLLELLNENKMSSCNGQLYILTRYKLYSGAQLPAQITCTVNRTEELANQKVQFSVQFIYNL